MDGFGVAAHARWRPARVAPGHGDRRIPAADLADLVARPAVLPPRPRTQPPAPPGARPPGRAAPGVGGHGRDGTSGAVLDDDAAQDRLAGESVHIAQELKVRAGAQIGLGGDDVDHPGSGVGEAPGPPDVRGGAHPGLRETPGSVGDGRQRER